MTLRLPGDRRVARGALAGRAQPPPTDEQLLLAEGDDGLELSLYLDAEVLRRLARAARCGS